jgi:hypothetical protein
MRAFCGGDEQLKFYLTVKYKMFMSRFNELLRRYWAAYVVFLVFILYLGFVPDSPSKAEGLIVLSLTGLALFIWGLFKS